MSEPNAPVTRRQFCAGACQVASCATLATLLTGCADGGSPTSPSGGGGAPTTNLGVLSGQLSGNTVRVNIAGSALIAEGGAARVESVAGLFLLARTSATAVQAIDGVCTHEGCTVSGVAGDIYVCPCHGSRYSRSGQVVNGPAKASLRQYTTTLADGIVTISL